MITFENGILKKGAYVIVDGKEYPVVMPDYETITPLSAENLNKMQEDLKEMIDNNKILGTVGSESGNIVLGTLQVEWGTISTTTPASGTSDVAVTFPTEFSNNPAVFTQAIGNYNTSAQVNDISKTSALVKCRSLDGKEHDFRKFYWLAIGTK